LVVSSHRGAKTTVNTCLNSLASQQADKCNKLVSRGYSVESRVFHVIDASEIELTPHEIAVKIYNDGSESWTSKKISPGRFSTVRGACTKLLQKGMVVQPYPGAYCNKITHGVRFIPLCVHNITLLAKVCQNLKSWQTDEYVGGVKIHVCFGRERKQVTGYIACDIGGMSHDACLLALNRWFEVVEGRLGYCLQDLVLQTVEFNKDYHGCRIDGMQCVTKKGLYGIIDRTYQKEEDVIRRERKVTQPMSINKFEAEIHRQMGDIGRGQEFFDLQQEVKRLSETQKFSNKLQLEQFKLLEAMYQALGKTSGGRAIENLESLLKEFTDAAKSFSSEAKVLHEAFGRLGDLESDAKRLVEGQRRLGEYVS
jgi:hypothetical protein